MSRFCLPLIALVVASCSHMPAGEPYLIPPTPPARTPCGAEKLGDFAYKTRTDAVSAEVARVSGAKSIRWISPGMAVTMDFREDRLNVHLNKKGVMEAFTCG